MIFNDLWNGICEVVVVSAEETKSEAQMKNSRPTIPTSNKERVIWKDKDQKSYDVIVVTVSEEVSLHIVYNNESYGALKKLNDLYDFHSELELIKFLVKLFNIELKNDDPMTLASEIKAIMHDIDFIGVNIYLLLTTFINAFYPTYYHYLESLQASGQMESITFDTLVKKVAECEKAFGKKST
jgi:hypothetical protein